MPHFLPVSLDGIPPEVSHPDPARVTSGDPVHTTWNIEERDGLYCGIWQSTPGAWRVNYTEWEYCRILSGVSILTEDGQPPVTLRAGDSFILRPGFTGIWAVIETTRKDYVIRV
ncbi:MAG: cupin domain-containing protein [Paracoccaceae bacterium]|nr:cupin domain-containing protein [Paracoccaceae bacterium]